MNKFKNTRKSRKNRKSKRIYGKGNILTIPKDNSEKNKKISYDIESQLPITDIPHESVSSFDHDEFYNNHVNDIEKGIKKKPIIIIDNNDSFDNLRPIESDEELRKIFTNERSMFPSIFPTNAIRQPRYYEGKRQIESPRHANERRPSSRSKSAPTVRSNELPKLKEYLENLPDEPVTFGGKKRRKRKTKRKNKKKRKTRKNNN